MVKAIIIEFLKVLFLQWCPDGCLRRTVEHEPPPPPTAPPPLGGGGPGMAGTTSMFGPGSSSHKMLCEAAEVARTRCLNGGSCFAIQLNNGIRDIGCSCPQDWVGERCQFVFIDPDLLAVQQENLRTAKVAASVSVVILVVFVILLSVYVYLRYKRKELRNSSVLSNRRRAAGGVAEDVADLDAVIVRRRPFLDTAPPPPPRTSLRESWKKSSHRLRNYFAHTDTFATEDADSKNNNPVNGADTQDKDLPAKLPLMSENGGGARNGSSSGAAAAARDGTLEIAMDDLTSSSSAATQQL